MTKASDNWRIGDILQRAIFDLENAGITEARTDAELLLGRLLGKSRTGLYLCGRDNLSRERYDRFRELLARRMAREPVAYIVGEREFWSLPFHVSPDVLIPRPETEFLLEVVLARKNRAGQYGYCLDLCCGSGVIAIILARELGRSVIALDISMAALEVTAKNCRRHDVSHRVHMVRADLGSCFRPHQPFSLIVSNPPYIRTDQIRDVLEPEVNLYEPHLALDGGSSGLEFIARIAEMLPSMLCKKGDAFFEIGDQQGSDVLDLLEPAGRVGDYDFIDIIQDYSGRDRVVHIRKA